jgi:hypothetical protein
MACSQGPSNGSRLSRQSAFQRWSAAGDWLGVLLSEADRNKYDAICLDVPVLALLGNDFPIFERMFENLLLDDTYVFDVPLRDFPAPERLRSRGIPVGTPIKSKSCGIDLSA